jgi:RNA polymerase sigma-70 factor (sigma-E family)
VNARVAGISDEAGGPGGRAFSAHPDGDDATAAVTDLFRQHHLELVRLALVMVGDLATAEDVVQDAFERLHRGWRGLRQPSSGLAYVRSSVLNGCRSVHRRAAVARKHVPRLVEPPGARGEDAASAAADRGEMAAALRQLPRRQREVLVLRYYLDLDVDEIAGTLRISPSAVRATNTRGLAALARALREQGGLSSDRA